MTSSPILPWGGTLTLDVHSTSAEPVSVLEAVVSRPMRKGSYCGQLPAVAPSGTASDGESQG